MVFLLLIDPKSLKFTFSGSLKLCDETSRIIFMVSFLIFNPKILDFTSSGSLNLHEEDQAFFFGTFITHKN